VPDGAVFPYLEQFERLPLLQQEVLLDTLPDLGTRRVQLWLANYMRRRAEISHHPDYEETADFEVRGRPGVARPQAPFVAISCEPRLGKRF
jgi:hypothetical protein